ncbi:MAG: hypothetical protein H7A23_04205 [Leptospiraceae bacterium]|nr:hypothetical protein [Leptospiraceae bacterium]MCP5493735.1 hypothetical protein [Leptospiraceae bacterium]
MKKFTLKILKSKRVWFLLLTIILYKLVFNPISGKFLVDFVFQKFSTGKFSGNVEQFSLFYGIEFTNVEIKSGADFDNSTILEAQRIAILYNLPRVFIGSLCVNEIAIIKPKVNLLQKKGNWNVATLFPSSGKKEKKEEKPSTPREEINIYIPISVYLNFLLEDLVFTIRTEEGDKEFSGSVEGLSLFVFLDTYRFSKIPLNLGILSSVKNFHVKLNPEKSIKIEFADKSRKLRSPFRLTWLLIQEFEKRPPRFLSKLDIGAEQIPIQINNQLVTPFDLGIVYDMFYNPKEDSLLLNDLKMTFEKDVWFQIDGKVLNAIKDNRNINFQITRSYINLAPISRVLQNIPGVPAIKLKGEIELTPMNVKGSLESLQAKGEIKFRNIQIFLKNQIHNIRFVRLAFEAIFNLTTKEKPTPENPLPFLTSLNISQFDISYNNILVKLKGLIKPKEKIDLDLSVQNIVLNQFVKTLSGYCSLNTSVKGQNFASLNANTKVNIRNFSYSIDKSKSGISHIILNIDSKIGFGANFIPQTVNINPANLTIRNSNNQDVTRFTTNGVISLAKGIEANISSFYVNVNFTNMLPTLPLSLKETITNLRGILGNEQEVKGNIHFHDKEYSRDIDGNIYAVLPGLKLGVFHYFVNLSLLKDSSATIQVHSFQLDAYNSKLIAKLNGTLKKVKNGILGGYTPNLNLELDINSSQKAIDILKNIRFNGSVNLDFNWKDYIIKGQINSKKTNFEFFQGICPGEECKKISIQNISFHLPIEHNLNIQTITTMIEGDKAKFIKTYGQEQKYNFSIDQIIAPHPHPSVKGKHIYYVKKVNNTPGIIARIDYIDNSLSINDLKIHTLNGIVFGKNILFNVGDGSLKNMEYAATLQFKDLDLKELLPQKSRESIDDGKIKADINISGKNLDDPINNLNLFFSVFQIGKDFGKSAIKIVSPESIITDYLVSSYNVDKINIELSRGLVYAKVLFKKWSLLSTLFLKVEDDKIVQERMPLANFLKRTETEISNYQ